MYEISVLRTRNSKIFVPSREKSHWYSFSYPNLKVAIKHKAVRFFFSIYRPPTDPYFSGFKKKDMRKVMTKLLIGNSNFSPRVKVTLFQRRGFLSAWDNNM